MGLSTPAPDLQDRLADLTLIDSATGAQVRLGDAWSGRIAVLVHLRHFGCLYCRKQVEELSKASAEIQALGAMIVAVGTGDVAYGKRFAAELKLPFPVPLPSAPMATQSTELTAVQAQPLPAVTNTTPFSAVRPCVRTIGDKEYEQLPPA